MEFFNKLINCATWKTEIQITLRLTSWTSVPYNSYPACYKVVWPGNSTFVREVSVRRWCHHNWDQSNKHNDKHKKGWWECDKTEHCEETAVAVRRSAGDPFRFVGLDQVNNIGNEAGYPEEDVEHQGNNCGSCVALGELSLDLPLLELRHRWRCKALSRLLVWVRLLRGLWWLRVHDFLSFFPRVTFSRKSMFPLIWCLDEYIHFQYWKEAWVMIGHFRRNRTFFTFSKRYL